MLNHIQKIYYKYKPILWYLFFGACTMILNTVVYAICYEILNINNILSTTIAWLIAVIGAYISNKIFVFESKAATVGQLLQEVWMFFVCRIATGVVDVAIMYVFVDILNWNATGTKIAANVVVVALNYVASKWFVFVRK